MAVVMGGRPSDRTEQENGLGWMCSKKKTVIYYSNDDKCINSLMLKEE